MTTDQDRVLYDLEPIELNESGVAKLNTALNDPSGRWYASRRLRALAAVGLMAASKWNPLAHPRGPDGRFIVKFGFVRWMFDGDWHRGQVIEIDDKGKVFVKPDNTGKWTDKVGFDNPSKRLYSLPTPKASLNLPNPKGSEKKDWKKTGGQGGSNPGGFFQLEKQMRINIDYSVAEIDGFAEHAGLDKYMPEGDLSPLDDLPDNGVFAMVDTTGKRQIFIGADGHWSLGDELGKPVEPGVFDMQLDILFGSPGTKQRTDSYDSLVVWKKEGETFSDNWVGKFVEPMSTTVYEPGDSFYVKTTKSESHAKNEILANTLYEMAGVAVPDMVFGSDSLEVGSKIVTGDSQVSLSSVTGDAEIMQKIREDMVVDAWLGNWDVAGLSLDNIIIVDGVPFRIDTGGALEYRAMGSPKGNKFGDTVGELDTFISGINPSSKKVFGGISSADLEAGSARIAAISPQDIRDTVEDHGLSPALADKLIARRKFILDKFDMNPDLADTDIIPLAAIQKGKKLAAKAKIKAPSEVWNPIDEEWQPGTPHSSLDFAEKAYVKTVADLTEITVGIDTLKKGDLFFSPDLEPFVVGNGVYINQYSGLSRATSPPPWDHVYVDELHQKPEDSEANLAYLLTTRASYEAIAITAAVDEYATVADIMDAGGVGWGTDHSLFVPRTSIVNHAPTQPYMEWDYRRDKNMPFDEGGGTFLHDPLTKNSYEVVGYQFEPNSVTLKNLSTGKELIYRQGDQDQIPMVMSRPADDFTTQLLKAKIERDKKLAKLKEPVVLKGTLGKPEPVGSVKANPPPAPKPTEVAVEAAKVDPPPVKIPTGLSKSVDGVNAKLPVSGEQISFYEYRAEILATADEEKIQAMKDLLIGQSVTIHQGNMLGSNDPLHEWGDISQTLGVWKITNVKMSAGAYNGPQLLLLAPNGKSHNMYLSNYNVPSTAKPFDDRDFIITPIAIDASIPQQQPSFKKNGDIVVGGIVIGRHDSKETYGYGGWGSSSKDYYAEIYPEFSVTGQKIKLKGDKQGALKTRVNQYAIPGNALEIHEKSKVSVNLESKVKASAVEGPSVGALIDGSEARRGQWVESAKDGLVGKITNWPNQEKYPGLVYVEPAEGGKKKLRKITTLKSATDPSKPAAAPSPYGHLSTSDGKVPAIGQKVEAGKKNAKIKGTIIKINPTKGWVTIQPDDGGKKMVKTLGTTTVLEDAPDAPVVALAAKAAGFDPPHAKAGLIKYATEEGTTLIQSNEIKEAWAKSPGRKLTKDGYAPQIGMRVRDSKDNALIVTEISSPYSSSPNRVKAVDIKSGKEVYRTVSALHVDHAAELGSQLDPNLKTIGKMEILNYDGELTLVNAPDGSILYKGQGQQYIAGGYRNVDVYFYVNPKNETQVTLLSQYGTAHKNGKSYIPELIGHGPIEKVGVFGDDDKHHVVYKPPTTGKYGGYGKPKIGEDAAQVLASYDPSVQTPSEAVGIVIKKKQSAGVPGADPSKTVDKSVSIGELPKPVGAPEGKFSEPSTPEITGDGVDFDTLPEKLHGTSAKSVATALSEVVDKRHSEDQWTGAIYSVGDSDHIEDMLLQTQIVTTPGQDKEFVEVRFRLLEDKAEEVAKKLVIAESNQYGGWSAIGDEVYPTDLGKGDTISVRRSMSTGLIKPNSGTKSQANATILTDPILLGKNEDGIDVYRIEIATASGDFAEVDVELRAMPSVQRYEWDPNMVHQTYGTNLSISQTAGKEGWVDNGGIGIEGVYSNGGDKVLMDATGAKMQDGTIVKSPGSSYGYSGDVGKRVSRTFDDGSVVKFNLTHSAMSGTQHGSIRRSNYSGDVNIRVPIKDKTPEEIEAAVSKAMEAVGVPIEAQGSPSDEDLAKFILYKIDKTYNRQYTHRDRIGIQSPTAGDKDVQTVLKHFDKIEGHLGRKVTLDDFQLNTYKDGRMQVSLSPEVARAITKSQGNKYYTHHSGASVDTIVEILAGSTPGLMSTHERWNNGVLTTGMSSATDMKLGSGNRIYMTGRKGGTISGGGNQFIFSATAINMSTEIYVNTGDGFGKRKAKNTFITEGGAHEYMYKRTLLPEQMAYISVRSKKDKDSIIKKLKSRGITTFNGLTLEEFILVSGMSVPTGTDEFQELGTDAAVETVSVTGLAGAVV